MEWRLDKNDSSLPKTGSPGLHELLGRHSKQLPRYTSYPTAVELKNLSRQMHPTSGWDEEPSEPVALYIHLPFCPRLCYFCACNKVISSDRSLIHKYVFWLEDELKLLLASLEYVPLISEIHLGGGSPSYLTVDELRLLDSIVSRHLYVLPDCVKSIEIDPRTFDHASAAALGELGFSRASIGVQDFSEEVQKIINREQSVALTKAACSMLREEGIKSLNIDLVYGLPEQTVSSFGRTIEEVIKLYPARLAVYGYAHVPWRVKTQRTFRKHHCPGPWERTNLFLAALQAFTEAGYLYIGLDHFALPDDELIHAKKNGYLRRNFMGYTAQRSSRVLGLGLSSISDNRTFLYQNSSKLFNYEQALKAHRLPIEKALKRSAEDLVREKIIQDLMCYGRSSPSRIPETLMAPEETQRIFGEARESLLMLENEGLVQQEGAEVVVTDTGQLFLRSIAAVFDTYRTHERDTPTFSQVM